MVCRGCEPPDVAADGQVIEASDPAVGIACGLATTDGRRHLWSATPGIAFVAVGILHYWWTDVFVLHVTIHFIQCRC